MRLESFGESRSGQVSRHWRSRRRRSRVGLLPFIQQAHRTAILAVVFLVETDVKQSADLVNPSLALVAFHPTFLVLFVVLLFLQLALANGQIHELNRDVAVQFVVTLIAPKVLIVTSDVKVAVATNPFARTVHSVTEEHWRFEQELLATAQGAGPITLATFLVLVVELDHHLPVVLDELFLQFIGHLIHNGAGLIVRHGVVEGKIDIGPEIFDGVVMPGIEALADGAKVHGLLDDVEVIGQIEFFWVDGGVEHPTVLMGLKATKDLGALRLQFGWRQLLGTIQRREMRGELFDGEAVEEGMIFRFLGRIS
mmetsp:Transcript_3872/g.10918  ORF Transcript_3872/g.10918 Transcript_3872/m.10918 type:complete len:310 (+) Transcript_3872:2210-3139(+)